MYRRIFVGSAHYYTKKVAACILNVNLFLAYSLTSTILSFCKFHDSRQSGSWWHIMSSNNRLGVPTVIVFCRYRILLEIMYLNLYQYPNLSQLYPCYTIHPGTNVYLCMCVHHYEYIPKYVNLSVYTSTRMYMYV